MPESMVSELVRQLQQVGGEILVVEVGTFNVPGSVSISVNNPIGGGGKTEVMRLTFVPQDGVCEVKTVMLGAEIESGVERCLLLVGTRALELAMTLARGRVV